MRGHNHVQRFLWLTSLVLVIALADQLIKQQIQRSIGPATGTHRVELLGHFLALEYVQNRGAAFGMFQQATTVFGAIAVVAIGFGVYMVWRCATAEPMLATGICLILGGALGNMIDRVTRGYVVDFIAIGNFWKFNLADSCITIGAMLTFWLLWRSDQSQSISKDQLS